jgi:Domain of unknown function (DUF4123)
MFGEAFGAAFSVREQRRVIVTALTLQQRLESAQSAHGSLHLYALADPAQQKVLPSIISTQGQSRCLFTDSNDSDIAKLSPHLVTLPAFNAESKAWRWILRNAPSSPCVTLIASPLNFESLFNHTKQFIEIKLPDNDELFFAFWDPAILGTLIGQKDDTTLHVKGPVLTPPQRHALLKGISAWWYWDRETNLHEINCSADKQVEGSSTPLALTQGQVDDLVEASVPDHVLYHIELNQPQLISDVEPMQRYRLVRQHLVNASEIKLEAMGDLVNYVCAALIYKEQLQEDSTIRALLRSVKLGELKFAQALEQFP